MKLIAFYLPQFYEFKENNEWWGEGFTEWTNVKKAKPLFKNHYQPTIPKDEYYYDLSEIDVMKWQIELAKNNGLYGFCFYHYWFGNNDKLMDIPVENYLNNKTLDFPYCLCWANHNWTRTWTGGDKEILKEVKYDGENELETHFKYLLPYFKDSRYIKIDNKPMFVIYMPELIPNLEEMKSVFNNLAKKNGLEGISFVSQAPQACINYKQFLNCIDYFITYEPNYTQQSVTSKIKNGKYVAALQESVSTTFCVIRNAFFKRINKGIFKSKINFFKTDLFSYDGTWKAILKRKLNNPKIIYGCFVGFDNSPRKGFSGMIYKGESSKKFRVYFEKFCLKHKKESKSEYAFIMAWNEWGEGAYLEPDQNNQYNRLDAVKSVLTKINK